MADMTTPTQPTVEELTDKQIDAIAAKIGSLSLHATRLHKLDGEITTIFKQKGLIEFARALLAAAPAIPQASERAECARCNGTGVVDDGELDCSEGGIPYECGPIKCVKDCPDCAARALPASEPTRQTQREHDYPIFQQFYAKHAQGALSAPSCLCCGQSTQGKAIGVQHLELPAIVICADCKQRSAREASEPVLLTDDELRLLFATYVGYSFALTPPQREYAEAIQRAVLAKNKGE